MIEYETRGSVAIVTLNRPAARNAINAELEQALFDALEAIDADPAVRAGVIAANGPVFCAGADLKQVATSGNPAGDQRPPRETIVSRSHHKPLVAAVQGPAYGGGFEIVLSCDMVVAAETAKFALSEVRWGLLASGGGMFRLPRRLPRNVAHHMLFTGGALSARRCYELGLVNELVEADDVLPQAVAMAQLVAANGPLAVRLTRQVIEETALLDDRASWELSRRLVARNFASSDASEGPRAFAEKREPVWTGS